MKKLRNFRLVQLALAACGAVALIAAAGVANAQVVSHYPSGSAVFRAPRLMNRQAGPPVQGEDYLVETPGPRMGPPPVPPGFVPWQQRMGAPRVGVPRLASAAMDDGAEEIAPGTAHRAEGPVAPVPEGPYFDPQGGMLVDPMQGGCATCGPSGCDTCGFNDDENDCCLIPCPSIKNFVFFAGTQGFTNPGNLGAQGSFGFNEGVNWGAPIRIRGCDTGIGAQVGIRAVQSNFSGSLPIITTDQRNQTFVTAGLFHRVDWGIQWGVVVDYLQDKWWYDIDLTQIRGEISWLYPCDHEVGFWFTASLREANYQSTNTASQAPLNSDWAATEIYALFYRRRFSDCECGSGGWIRVFGGFTGAEDAIIGTDMSMPLNDRLTFQVDATYLIPNQGTDDFQNPLGSAVYNEAWNLSINLVWHPRCNARSPGYYTPLMNVANNGTLIVDRIESP